jgi:filamentous hemagglutinin family protein
MTHQSDRTWKIGFISILITVVASGERVFAQSQIVPDNTMGAENSQVIPNANGLPIELIDGGARRGANLFHSFQEFNINNGRGAYFINPAGVENILSRVTGTNPSNILGTLGVLGNANLFLINPNGIIFGQNASLDVNGSFVATTANAVQFGERGVFSAKDPNAPPLLTVNPSAFLFNQIATQQSAIEHQGILRVPDGKSLLLVGGNVNLNFGYLFAPGGRVELVGVAGSGSAELTVDGNNLSLSFPSNTALADISLTNESFVDVTAGGGGSIAIAARNLELLDSILLAGIGFSLGSTQAQAGNITIQATENVTIQSERSSGFIFNFVFPGGEGNAGDIIINARSLSLTNNSTVSSSILGEGNAGDIIINARSLSLTNDSQVSSATLGEGNAGDIIINARSLFLTNGSQVSSATLGQGAGGNLTVNASDSVRLIGTSANGRDASGLFASSEDLGNGGNGGNLSLNTGNLIVSGGAQVRTNTIGQGAGGNLTVNVSDSVRLIGTSANGRFASGLFASSENLGNGGSGGNLSINTGNLIVSDGARISSATENDGDAGNLSINTGNLIVRNGSQVISATRGQGAGGSLTVNATDSVQLIGISADGVVSGLLTQTENRGNAGNLRIDTGNLIVSDGARVSSATFDEGAGGSLTVNASDSVRLIGTSADGREVSGLFAGSENRGNAGNLRIDTENLIISGGAQVSSSTRGQGASGSLTVNASDSVRLIGTSADGRFASGFFASSENLGNAGNLRIDTGNLIVSDGAQVSSGTIGEGAGGSLTVNASNSVRLIGTSADGQFPSSLTATTRASGDAGDLTLKTRQFIIEDGGQISSQSTATGIAGDITLQTNSLFLEGEGSSILADTASTDGGNISLQVNDRLLLRNGSQISTTAGTERAGGNGGNIDIDSQFILAVPSENSDITANAYEGRGGNVNVTAQGIFGIEFREKETNFSDITASSQFGVDGSVQIDNPNVDPSRRVVNLPNIPVEVEIVQACQPSESQQSEFVITGRGGLPPSAQEILSTDTTGIDWVTLNPNTAAKPETITENAPSEVSRPIVEAQGWVVAANGKIILTAQNHTVTPAFPWLPNGSCKES